MMTSLGPTKLIIRVTEEQDRETGLLDSPLKGGVYWFARGVATMVPIEREASFWRL